MQRQQARRLKKVRYTDWQVFSQPESELFLFFRSSPKRKVRVIGLDCADPELAFGRWFDGLPNIKRVLDTGVHGKLRRVTPPITVPAWGEGKRPGGKHD
jgi:Type I phosphodiesterase / nucleotide pyrophosphatase